jgi:hypothetical protein
MSVFNSSVFYFWILRDLVLRLRWLFNEFVHSHFVGLCHALNGFWSLQSLPFDLVIKVRHSKLNKINTKLTLPYICTQDCWCIDCYVPIKCTEVLTYTPTNIRSNCIQRFGVSQGFGNVLSRLPTELWVCLLKVGLYFANLVTFFSHRITIFSLSTQPPRFFIHSRKKKF